jgi:hypothetical protein
VSAHLNLAVFQAVPESGGLPLASAASSFADEGDGEFDHIRTGDDGTLVVERERPAQELHGHGRRDLVLEAEQGIQAQRVVSLLGDGLCDVSRDRTGWVDARIDQVVIVVQDGHPTARSAL